MKALSIKQPWATLIANGIKTLEVRSWKVNYRGPLVIVSSKQPNRIALEEHGLENAPNGVTIALVDLFNVREGRRQDKKAALVDPTGKYVWEMRMIQKLPAVPVKGRLGFYDLPVGVARKCGLTSGA
ncbi:MAG: ASCH domain-containing protein [Acidobacteria bacterium]|nr:ASCH domain-containing protein [Acidobacteriota bacterium]